MNKIKKSIFSFVLALAMVMSIIQIDTLPVFASGTTYNFSHNGNEWTLAGDWANATAGDTISVTKTGGSGIAFYLRGGTGEWDKFYPGTDMPKELQIPDGYKICNVTTYPTGPLAISIVPIATESKYVFYTDGSKWTLDNRWQSATSGDTISVSKTDGGGRTSYLRGGTGDWDKAYYGTDMPFTAVIPEGYEIDSVQVYTTNESLEIKIKPLHTCTLGSIINGQDATCTEDGWNGYYQCTDATCGKIYASNDTTGTSYDDLDGWKASEAGNIAKLGHVWGYTANGATLTATCSRDDSHTLPLTLTASSPNYSGNAATITIGTPEQQSTWTGADLTLPTVVTYETSTGTDLGTTAPTTAGSYVAKVSPVGETATNANTAKVSFTILKSVTGVTLNKETTTIKVGSEETLVATVDPTDAANKNVTWSSDDTSIATVDTNGKVTAVSAGTVDITAKTENGGITAKCTVTVEPLEFADVKDKIMGVYEYGGYVWNVSETGISWSWLNKNFDLCIYQADILKISETENSIDINLNAFFDWDLKFNIESGKAVSLVDDIDLVHKLAGDYNYDGNTLTITGDGTLSGIMVKTALYSHPEITKVVVSGYEEINKLAFYKCPTTVTSVTLSDSIKTIGTSAFSYCSDLTNITLGSNVETIADGAFAYTGISEINIPDSVESIGDGAFYACSSLETVNLGRGIATIGDWAFENNTALKEITIPNSVKRIGKGAFGYTYDGDSKQDLPLETFKIKGHGTGEGCVAYDYYAKETGWKYINLDAKPTETDNISVSGLNATLSFTENKAEESTLHIDGIALSDVYQSDATTAIYEGVYVTCDGNPLKENTDYKVTEGSVKVTFTEKFLNSLGVGSHTIKTYLNGTEAANNKTYDYVFETKITVTPKPSTGGGSSLTPTTTPTYKAPNTYVEQDNNPMSKTISLLSIALVAGCIARKKKED